MSFPWPHFDDAVYWHLPDDGASFRCADCHQECSHDEVLLTQIPIDDSRKTLCMECLDEGWLRLAKDLGKIQ